MAGHQGQPLLHLRASISGAHGSVFHTLLKMEQMTADAVSGSLLRQRRLPMHTASAHLPVELLADLDGRRLLALQPQAVHGVGQVDGLLCRHVADEAHAPIKVCVDAQHLRAMKRSITQLS